MAEGRTHNDETDPGDADELVAWLENKWVRHGELEDLQGARLIETLADQLAAMQRRAEAAEAELAATKGGPVSCDSHGWVGDDNCAYCRAEAAEADWQAAERRLLEAQLTRDIPASITT